MPGARLAALSERYHLILTVWPSKEHRTLGGFTLRAASGVQSATGAMIRITDAAGKSFTYPPTLPDSTRPMESLDIAPRSMTVNLPWLNDDIGPGQVDFRSGWAEIAEIEETSSGTSVQAWEKRRRIIVGPLTRIAWGDSREFVSITFGEEEFQPAGSFWTPGAEFDSVRFPDIANTGTRDRAPQADGLLPPIVIAPVGSNLRAPCIVVQDEDNASAGVSSLIPRRWVMGTYRPTSATVDHQFLLIDDEQTGKSTEGVAAAAYQATPAQGADSLGEFYWYVADSFAETFGTGTSIVFNNGSATVTAAQQGGKIGVGDQIRRTGDAADKWMPIDSIEGDTVTLTGTYGGTTGTGTGEVSRLPASQGYTLYHVCSLGGIEHPTRADEPLAQALEVLVWAIRQARPNIPVAYGDLEALRQRFWNTNISAVINDREQGNPWEWSLDRLLRWMPIRPVRSGGRIRFVWVGPITASEIVTEIDLDSLGSAYRKEPVAWTEDGTPLIRMAYWWDVWKERHFRTLAIDGSIVGVGNTNRTTTGRAEKAWHAWRAVNGSKRADHAPTIEFTTDAIESRVAAGLASAWMMHRWGLPRRGMVIEVDAAMRWLKPGMAMRITETDVTKRSAVWRVVSRGYDGIGRGAVELEEVVW